MLVALSRFKKNYRRYINVLQGSTHTRDITYYNMIIIYHNMISNVSFASRSLKYFCTVIIFLYYNVSVNIVLHKIKSNDYLVYPLDD